MKKLLLVILTLALVVLAACSSNSEPQGPVLNPFVGGQDGLALEFIQGMPPVEEGAILDNDKSSFSIGVQLTNVGEYDIDPQGNGDLLDLRVRGVLPGQFAVTQADLEQQISDPLRGARKNIDGSILDGEFTTATFNDLRYQPDSQGDVPKSFVVDVCYDYKTTSTTPVCIADDVTDAITSANAQGICTISGPKQSRNSGGPVQISEFRQQPQGGNKVSIIFTVTHVGTGEIYRFQGNNVDPCDDSISNTAEQGEVFVEVSLPPQSTSTIDCAGGFTSSGGSSSGYVKLFDGNPRAVTCTLEETSGQQGLVYEDLLQVDLSYRYYENLRRSIVIKDAGN